MNCFCVYSFISNFGSQNVHATAFHQFLELGAQIEHSDYCVDALSRFSNILIIDIKISDRPPRASLACIQKWEHKFIWWVQTWDNICSHSTRARAKTTYCLMFSASNCGRSFKHANFHNRMWRPKSYGDYKTERLQIMSSPMVEVWYGKTLQTGVSKAAILARNQQFTIFNFLFSSRMVNNPVDCWCLGSMLTAWGGCEGVNVDWQRCRM